MDDTVASRSNGPGEGELSSSNPATGEPIGRVPISSPDHVRRAVRTAREAQKAWARLSPRQRSRAMRPLRRVIVERADALARLEVEEQGKTLAEAYGVILNLLHYLGYLRRIAPRRLKDRRARPLFGLHRVHRIDYRPYGVVAVIAPGNYPLTLSLEPLLAALLAGNAAVLKPSEHTPLLGLEIERLFRDAGLPDDLVQVVTGTGETGRELIASGVDKVVFTGSAENGRRVAAIAARRLIPVTLELGSQDAAIVLEDADLDRAAAGIVWGANLNAGQACLAIERVYVADAVADRLIAILGQEMRALRVGNGLDAGTDIGAITTEAQIEIIEKHVRDAVSRGARLVQGGERLPGPGRFFAPTLIDEVTDDMHIFQEESFGPLIAIQRFSEASEAVARVNRPDSGLTCSVWTRNLARARELARRIEAGDVAINEHGAPAGHAEIPWGGVKGSGYGRTRGAEGLLEMVCTRHISWPRIQTRREPYWFPNTSRKVKLMRGAIRFLYGSWGGRTSLRAATRPLAGMRHR